MKGSITPVIPQGSTIWFEYNPPELESSKDVNWAEIAIPGLNFPLQQFVNGGLTTLSLSLYFNSDNYARPFDVKDAVKKLEALIEKDEATLAPPVCLFSWGTFQVTCLIGSVRARYTMFNRQGIPLEATVDIALRGYQEVAVDLTPVSSAEDATSHQKPVFSGKRGSGSMFASKSEGNIQEADELTERGSNRSYIVSQGETLQSIATKFYGTPRYWRVIEFANKGNDIYQSSHIVKAGIKLNIPDPRYSIDILERITNFSEEVLEGLRIIQKSGIEGEAQQIKSSLGVVR